MHAFSLLEWTRDVLLKAVTEAFFGGRLLELEPQLLQYFAAFDDESWKITYKYPRNVSRDMYRAKDKILEAIEAYLRLPSYQRPDAAWLIRNSNLKPVKLGSVSIISRPCLLRSCGCKYNPIRSSSHFRYCSSASIPEIL